MNDTNVVTNDEFPQFDFAELYKTFLSNFAAKIFEVRDKLVVNGQLDAEKYLAALAEASEDNVRAAQIMARHAESTNNVNAKAMFDKWVTTFQSMRDTAMAPGFSYQEKVNQFNARFLSGLGKEFEAFGRTTTLGGLFSKLATGYDFGNLAAAAVTGDADLFAKTAAGMIGAYVGEIGTAIFFGSSPAGWAAAGTIALGSFIGSQFGEKYLDGPIRDFILRFGDSSRYITPERALKITFGTSDDDALFVDVSPDNAVFAADGNDSVIGSLFGDIIDGADGNDTLRGMAGDDFIYGGGGTDVLVGGAGSDTLQDDAGFDTYQFSSSDFESGAIEDTIIDADGNGRITFNDLDISGTGIGFDTIHNRGIGTWETSDGAFRLNTSLTDVSSDLIIVHVDSGSRIVVKNWVNGALGIALPGFDETHPANSTPLTNDDDAFGSNGNNSGVDIITALGGNDGIEGGAGDDDLDGGEGSDLIFGGSGNDHIQGGDGDDLIIDGSEEQNFRDLRTDDFDAAGKSEQDRFEDDISRLGSEIRARGKNWYIYGSINTGSTVFVPGTAYLDPNTNRSGDDVIDGGAGNDLVFGGEGRDTILGGEGNDNLVGGHDNDVIDGGIGDDIIDGDVIPMDTTAAGLSTRVSDSAEKNGRDTLFAGNGNDVVHGGGGNDVIYGEAGDDDLSGRGQGDVAADAQDGDSDYIDGGDGNDTIFGDDGDDTLLGGAGADAIRGDNAFGTVHAGNDDIDGGDGNDVVMGGSGADTLFGDARDLEGSQHGADVLRGSAGNDTLIGGGGNDVLEGGDDDDLLIGDDDDSVLDVQFHGQDQLFGGNGDDQLLGNGGDDVLDGGADNDELWGGEGNDQLAGGDGVDMLQGEAGDDVLAGDGGDDQLWGGAGNDRLAGGAGIDQLSGGEGDDRIDGGEGNDVLDAGDGADRLDGGAGNDTLDGDAGNDVLLGGAGDDGIFGGGGDDVIEGGAGNDAMNGAGGNDVYVFNAGWGQDAIQGLAGDAGADVIRFGAGVSASALQVSLSTSGDLLLASGADVLTLQGFAGMTGAAHRIEFADGTVWTMTDVAARFRPGDGSFYGGAGNDSIVGGGGDDAIDGGLGDDVLLGGDGDDHISGGLPNEGLSGGGVVTTASDTDVLFGGVGNDVIDAGQGDDVLDGGVGDDTLRGGLGADRLLGGDGNDDLDAGWWMSVNGVVVQDAADDVVDGGAGDDRLVGGLGRNTYLFATGFGHDRLELGRAGAALSGAGIADETAVLRFAPGIGAADVTLLRSGGDLVVRIGDDSISIIDYASRGGASVEFVFDDGSTLDADQLAILAAWPGSAGTDTLSGAAGDDVISGLAGDDTLIGNAGNDVLDGGSGADRLDGGVGDDVYRYALDGGRDRIQGDAAGNDVLEFGAGITADDLAFEVDGATLRIIVRQTGNYVETVWSADEAVHQIDMIRFADGSTLNAGEIAARVTPLSMPLNFMVTDVERIDGNAYANDFVDRVWGSSQAQVVLAGGGGDDNYHLNDDRGSNSVILENAGEGNDTIFAAAHSYTLAANVENLVALASSFIGTGPRNLVGNAADNIIDVSQAGSSVNGFRLDGGAGADALIGGYYDDTFVLDDANDVIFESSASTSNDTVEAAFSYSIADSFVIENVTLTGNTDTTAAGNAGSNRLDGSKSSGANTLTGGAGDDIYVVGNGDAVVEGSAEGTDTVIFETGAAGSYNVAGYANVERFQLGDSAFASALVGDAAANELVGNSAANELHGGSGNDVLRDSFRQPDWNQTDRDTLFGDDGDDTLISLFGVDELTGGLGNDTLQGKKALFHYARGDGDDVIVGSGIDGTASLVFGASVAPDEVTLARDGNALMVNIAGVDSGSIRIAEFWSDAGDIVSSVKAIVFKSDAGFTTDVWTVADMLGHLRGISVVGDAGDNQLLGGDGYDRLEGGAGNDTLDGGTGKDTLLGGVGDDSLDGGTGNDTLDGGSGFDTYTFSTADFSDFSEGRSLDTIIDADAQGKITIDGVTLGTGDLAFKERVDAGVASWETTNDAFRLSTSVDGAETTLWITHVDSGAIIRVRDWHAGDLGIALPAVAEPAAGATVAMTAGADLFGEFLADGTATNLGVDTIAALGGNDGIDAGFGDDTVDAGAGDDLVFGSAGDDVLRGGDDNDVLIDVSGALYDMKERDLTDVLDANAALGWTPLSMGRSWAVLTDAAALRDFTQQNVVLTTGGAGTFVELDPNQYQSGDDVIDGDLRVIAGEHQGNDVIGGGSGNLIFGDVRGNDCSKPSRGKWDVRAINVAVRRMAA